MSPVCCRVLQGLQLLQQSVLHSSPISLRAPISSLYQNRSQDLYTLTWTAHCFKATCFRGMIVSDNDICESPTTEQCCNSKLEVVVDRKELKIYLSRHNRVSSVMLTIRASSHSKIFQHRVSSIPCHGLMSADPSRCRLNADDDVWPGSDPIYKAHSVQNLQNIVIIKLEIWSTQIVHFSAQFHS